MDCSLQMQQIQGKMQWKDVCIWANKILIHKGKQKIFECLRILWLVL